MLLNHQPQFFNPVVPSMDYHHPHHPHHPPVDAFHAHHHGYFHPSELSLDNSSPSATASPEMCIPPGLVYPPHQQPSTPLFHAHQLQQQQEYVPTAHNPLKRSPSPTPSLSVEDDSDLMLPASPTKKSRNERGERISSKDFVPPDVTGLSKREARLVKNRAAAFLSRQRKREEFEALEVRVQELEMENVHLRNGSGGGGGVASPPPPSSASSSPEDEMTRLRSELSTSTRRCTLLEKDLHRLRQQQQQIKSEPVEDEHELSSVGSQSPLMPPSLCGGSSTSSTSEDEGSFNSKGMMMALLLLLAPVLSPSSPSSSQQSTNPPPFFHDAFEPFHSGSAALPINFWDSAPTPTTTTTLSFDHLSPWSAPTPSTSSSFEFDFPPTPSSPPASKRQVELDVQLTRSPHNPDRVKVKIVEPFSPSSFSLPMTPPPTASDFLSPALPSSYSFVSGTGAEKKRVKIAVVGENGDWEVEVK